MKEHIPKYVEVQKQVEQGNKVQLSVPVNLDLWLKSYEKNPNPDKMFTV